MLPSRKCPIDQLTAPSPSVEERKREILCLLISQICLIGEVPRAPSTTQYGQSYEQARRRPSPAGEDSLDKACWPSPHPGQLSHAPSPSRAGSCGLVQSTDQTFGPSVAWPLTRSILVQRNCMTEFFFWLMRMGHREWNQETKLPRPAK